MRSVVQWGIAGGLLALSLYYAAFSNFNFGNLCVWGLAALCLAYAAFWRSIDPWLAHGVGLAIKLALLAGCAFFVLVLGVILYGQLAGGAAGGEQALVVLGCAVHGDKPSQVLVCRLEAAYAYYTQNPGVTIVVCGGQGPEESLPEGVVMQHWLVARGVPQAQILVDDASTSTEENFRCAKALLAEAGIATDAPIAYVTNGFHCYRAGQYARREGFAQPVAVAAGLPLMQIPTCYLREVFALVYYWVCKSPNWGLMRRLVGVLCAGARRFR